jgi:ubiquitin C-terminal hydrolase
MSDKTDPSLPPGCTSTLANLGNTCFVNAALQCFAHIPIFVRFVVRREEYAKHIREDKPEGQLVTAWHDLCRQMWRLVPIQNGRQLVPYVAPHNFIRVMRHVAHRAGYPMLTHADTNDTHEFINLFLDGLHTGIARPVSMRITGGSGTQSLEVAALEAWRSHFEKEYSSILPMFYGQEHQICKCNNCGWERHSYDPFATISLAVATSIKQAFEDYCTLETIAYNCDKCGKGGEGAGTIRRRFWHLPPILIVLIKRYSNANHKLSAAMHIPLKNIDLVDVVDGSRGGLPRYDVVGACHHMGPTGGGHYTAACRDPRNHEWFLYDDESVSRIPPSHVCSKNTYVVFLQRQ